MKIIYFNNKPIGKVVSIIIDSLYTKLININFLEPKNNITKKDGQEDIYLQIYSKLSLENLRKYENKKVIIKIKDKYKVLIEEIETDVEDNTYLIVGKIL